MQKSPVGIIILCEEGAVKDNSLETFCALFPANQIRLKCKPEISEIKRAAGTLSSRCEVIVLISMSYPVGHPISNVYEEVKAAFLKIPVYRIPFA